MTALDERLERYAELLVAKGCALREGQELFVRSPIEVASFTRKVVACAYAHGAKLVTVQWGDQQTDRLAYDNAPQEVFDSMPEWAALRNNSMARNGAAVLTILSDDPQIMKGVDQRKVMARIVAGHAQCKEFYDALDRGRCVWCIAGAASPAWARQVFPQLGEQEAVEALWEAILDTSRVTDDPAAAWDEHRASFDARKAWLDEQGFTALHYSAPNGTDLTVGLIEGSHWEGQTASTSSPTSPPRRSSPRRTVCAPTEPCTALCRSSTTAAPSRTSGSALRRAAPSTGTPGWARRC